jgi:hypothetical protein
VAILAGGRPLLHVSVAAFAGLVGEVFAEPFDLAASFRSVALGAVTANLFLVSLVVEFYTPFELQHVSGEGGAGEGDKANHYNKFLHFYYLRKKIWVLSTTTTLGESS